MPYLHGSPSSICDTRPSFLALGLGSFREDQGGVANLRGKQVIDEKPLRAVKASGIGLRLGSTGCDLAG